MRLLFDITHPADVHQFRFLIEKLKVSNEVIVIARKNKESVIDLLRSYNISYIPRMGFNNIFGKLLGLIVINLQILVITRKFKPDIMIGSTGNCYVAQVSKLLKIPSIILDDTEHTSFQNKLTFPFATKIITPSSYFLNLGKKQIKYDGSKEMFYLSKNYFKPNTLIKNEFSKYPKVFFLRFIAWDGNHDIGKSFLVGRKELINYLEQYGKVYISSEGTIESSLAKYKIPNELKKEYHSVLYYSDLVISEGASTAAEAAVLGTPCIYTNPLPLGYINYFISKDRIRFAKNFAQVKSLINENLVEQKWIRKEICDPVYDLNEFIINELEKLYKQSLK